MEARGDATTTVNPCGPGQATTTISETMIRCKFGWSRDIPARLITAIITCYMLVCLAATALIQILQPLREAWLGHHLAHSQCCHLQTCYSRHLLSDHLGCCYSPTAKGYSCTPDHIYFYLLLVLPCCYYCTCTGPGEHTDTWLVAQHLLPAFCSCCCSRATANESTTSKPSCCCGCSCAAVNEESTPSKLQHTPNKETGQPSNSKLHNQLAHLDKSRRSPAKQLQTHTEATSAGQQASDHFTKTTSTTTNCSQGSHPAQPCLLRKKLHCFADLFVDTLQSMMYSICFCNFFWVTTSITEHIVSFFCIAAHVLLQMHYCIGSPMGCMCFFLFQHMFC